jgi:hypothetical protein
MPDLARVRQILSKSDLFVVAQHFFPDETS